MDKIPGKFEIDSLNCVTYSPISIEDGGLIGWHWQYKSTGIDPGFIWLLMYAALAAGSI